MATCSKRSIESSLWASSFCERSILNFCANQFLTLKNTLLGDFKTEKSVMCRVNRYFTVFMHKHYQQVADKQFGFGVLKAKDNKEEEDGYTVDLNLQK